MPATIIGGVLCGVLLAVAPASAAEPLYQKKTTWQEAMLSARTAVLALQQAERRQTGGENRSPFISEPISGEGPGQKISVDVSGVRFMRLVTVIETGGGNCHIWGDARLIAKDGRAVWLGEIRPAAINVGWGRLLVDRNWQDHPLKIGERKFAHGIWIHANSDVAYALDGKYERFEAHVGMDADRATGTARFKVLFDLTDPVPMVWKQIAHDYPEQSRWFEEDSGRRPTQWFADAQSVVVEQAAVGRVLGQIGPAAPLRKELQSLVQNKVPGSDPRWLNLYVRACRCRAAREPLERVWLVDLRRLLDAQFEPLLESSVPADDPRWESIQTKVARISQVFAKPSSDIDLAAMRNGIAALAKAMPGRFAGDPLMARLDAIERRWQPAMAAVVAGDEKAMADLPQLAEDVRGLRHATLAAVGGMEAFLAAPANAAMEREWETQYESLRGDLGNRGYFARVASETFRGESLILETDRDPADVALRRTAALVEDLRLRLPPGTLADLEKDLAALQSAAAAIDVKNTEARYVLYAAAAMVRRQIAFRNPLLGFNQIVFIKHSRALYDHMCDQYYGMAARPGGGLYVLSNPFGPNPTVRDVLAGKVVERGRLKGKPLPGGPNNPPAMQFDGMGNLHGPKHEGGCFLSPDLSFDGKQIVFAYVECSGDKKHRHHVDPSQGHWFEGRCFHVFKVNADGTGLEQLTDGTWNDFDPCWLPNGRIAFISERRGGYLRCGRVCPTYTLYDMAADGGDITCLSFHETNEWHPSVTHDGRILYTRWDYVDRFGCTAHLPWITTVDGRDSRAVHGNFAPRADRPDMELDCRVIPGSPKFVATAAPHHGQAYGSLVVVDPRVADDDRMAPVRRLTPEVGFPESQGGAQVYATAWPLSEDYYLAVYDAAMKPGMGYQGGDCRPGTYGIYLIDSFGNRELIYRDPEIACLSPIPLVPRTKPPVAPELVRRGPDTDPAARAKHPDRKPEAAVSVLNVYDSLKAWPEGTKIKELRVFQVLPMSVPSGAPPHDTGVRIAGAGDSVVVVRHLLGTVPVEPDGSAHFVVPANKELFFQAIDQEGLAVQSMRSATYLHEGERLVCVGCHEPKHRAVQPVGMQPLAMRREPSRPRPDVDGSNPFSYPRLVQPVLDAKCVQCHQEKKAMNLARDPLAGHWFASYNNLVQGGYAFYDYRDGYRTTPGKFGARASKLYELLKKGHYDVKLSDDEWHRLTLWIDCSSMFYGVYEKEGGEAQLRGEIARPTLE